MYNQFQFREDLAMLERAAADGGTVALAGAIARGRSLLKAGGQVGSIISGSNRMDLQRVLSNCESAMNSGGGGAAPAGPIMPEVQAPQDMQNAGTVDPGSSN